MNGVIVPKPQKPSSGKAKSKVKFGLRKKKNSVTKGACIWSRTILPLFVCTVMVVIVVNIYMFESNVDTLAQFYDKSMHSFVENTYDTSEMIEYHSHSEIYYKQAILTSMTNFMINFDNAETLKNLQKFHSQSKYLQLLSNILSRESWVKDSKSHQWSLKLQFHWQNLNSRVNSLQEREYSVANKKREKLFQLSKQNQKKAEKSNNVTDWVDTTIAYLTENDIKRLKHDFNATSYNKDTLYFLYKLSQLFDNLQKNMMDSIPAEQRYLIQNSFAKIMPKQGRLQQKRMQRKQELQSKTDKLIYLSQKINKNKIKTFVNYNNIRLAPNIIASTMKDLDTVGDIKGMTSENGENGNDKRNRNDGNNEKNDGTDKNVNGKNRVNQGNQREWLIEKSQYIIEKSFEHTSAYVSKWNNDTITQLLSKRDALYEKWNILGLTSDVSYDLMELELRVFETLIAKQLDNNHCPEFYFSCQMHECGFTCQLDDYLAICAKEALAKGYSFDLYEGNLIEYGRWTDYLMPISNLDKVCSNNQLEIRRRLKKRSGKYIYWIPKDVEKVIKSNSLHSDPSLWFHGILDRFLVRFNDKNFEKYNKIRNAIVATREMTHAIPQQWISSQLEKSQFNKEKKRMRTKSQNDLLMESLNLLLNHYDWINYIGLHVRRTDKIEEALVYNYDSYLSVILMHLGRIEKYNWQLYMIIDTIYQNVLSQLEKTEKTVSIKPFNITIDLSRVNKEEMKNDYKLIENLYQILTDVSQFPSIYLASDDAVLIDQITTITPELNVIVNPYSFVMFDNGTVFANQRYTDNSLISVIIDMFMLAETGMFIGQDSSRVSRFVLQLISTNHYNFDQIVASVDNYEKEHTIGFPWWMVDQ